MMTEEMWDKLNYYYREMVLFNVQNVGITISHLVVALVAILLSLILSAVVRSTLKKRVFRRLKLDEGLEYALLKLVHYVIVVIGAYMGLKSINLPLGALVGLFAIIGVGIGFGLQNIASNFISGMILLLDRPVKVGDRLEVGDVWGDVVKINLRTTVIMSPDDIAIIVPNSRLLEENVTNYSYGNPRIRLHVPVGIAYGSDVGKAEEVLLRAARDNFNVLKDPPPKVWFREFGDSSLNLELLAWIPTAKRKFDVASELNHAIDRGFRESGIEIPFPQRDLHLRSADAALRFGRDADGTASRI